MVYTPLYKCQDFITKDQCLKVFLNVFPKRFWRSKIALCLGVFVMAGFLVFSKQCMVCELALTFVNGLGPFRFLEFYSNFCKVINSFILNASSLSTKQRFRSMIWSRKLSMQIQSSQSDIYLKQKNQVFTTNYWACLKFRQSFNFHRWKLVLMRVHNYFLNTFQQY